MQTLLDRLERERILPREALLRLLCAQDSALDQALSARARAVRERYYGRDVYIRGLIECTSFCKNDCYYCGLRRGNPAAERYRLTRAQILECCRTGWELGFQTFVLQGGEDPAFRAQELAGIVADIKAMFPACAVTLSFGEHPPETYALWREAGADRYLLRHEAASPALYRRLHPAGQSLENRMRCLWSLKALGYQVGAGFMIGAPGQTADDLVDDLLFLHQLQPDMVGAGPFLPHHDTPFAGFPAGSLHLTLRLLSLLRLMLPAVLLPATTALASLDPHGRALGMQAGANVVMPNLSPAAVRGKYLLYDHKLFSGGEAAESLRLLREEMHALGYTVVSARGDSRMNRP